MSKRVQVLDSLSKEVLFECSLEDRDLAFNKAAEFEEMGLEVLLITPSIIDPLELEVESCSYNCRSSN